MSATKLLLATTNKKKLEEITILLAEFQLEFTYLKDFPQIKDVAETGKTFKDNATLKALGYAAQTGLLTLAEDSGICCDALDGAPGVYSARFAGEGKSDAANNEKLLKLLTKVPDNCRGAHYTSALALAAPGKIINVVEGHVFGVITEAPKGSHGFGYDPLFFYPPFGKTFGEVPASMKNEVSHRAQAFEKMKSVLRKWWAVQDSNL